MLLVGQRTAPLAGQAPEAAVVGQRQAAPLVGPKEPGQEGVVVQQQPLARTMLVVQIRLPLLVVQVRLALHKLLPSEQLPAFQAELLQYLTSAQLQAFQE